MIVHKAKHAILGAMIGDALGTTFEFTKKGDAIKIADKYSNKLNYGLIGAGPFNLSPGQFTDDTEMSLAIMSIIVNRGIYDQYLVSKAYHEWYQSNPFDIGNTVFNAISHKSRSGMLHAARKYNNHSLSNGFLMRLFGLVSLYYNKSKYDLVYAIIQDIELTHSHPETIHIGIIYGLMLNMAIHGSTANQIYWWGRKNCKRSKLFNTIYHAVNKNQDWFVYDGKRYDLSRIDQDCPGFVGYACWLLLFSLKFFSSYQTTMMYIVQLGGDTDTNACIVGAIMGSLYPSTIPKAWIKSVTSFRSESRFNEYPISNPTIWLQWLPK